jgi:hypothetical protein
MSGLTWIDDRWRLDGKGIHAGDGMEMRFPDGTWIRGRIESQDVGRVLLFYFDFHGMSLRVRVDHDELRWPGKEAACA